MKSNSLIIFSIWMILIFSGCSNYEKSIIDSIEKYHLTTNDSIQYIIYIPPGQCKKCFQFTCDSSYNYIKNRIHLILNQDTTYFKGFKHAYIEKDKLFYQNKLINTSNKIIVYKNKDLIEIVNLEDLEWIKDYDKKYYGYE